MFNETFLYLRIQVIIEKPGLDRNSCCKKNLMVRKYANELHF